MTTKHADGPWTIDGDMIRGQPRRWPKRVNEPAPRVEQTIVAVMPAGDGGSWAYYTADVAAANRRLVRVAPELFDAAIRVATFLITTGQHLTPQAEALRAAIAKVEGVS